MRQDLQEIIGKDGLVTLVLSNLLILATAGLSWLWQLGCVHRVARRAADSAPALELAMVLGFRLKDNGVCREYAQRLDRARVLLSARTVQRVVIVGGRTGNAEASEAAMGKQFLVARGVPESAILLEESSRHTLENLRHARATIRLDKGAKFVLITSRYHLARSLALALGLNLRPLPCAAEARLSYDPRTIFKLAREAYFLHWYHVGRIWSRWTGNRKSLARIT